MTKHSFVALLMIGAIVGSIQAQGLPRPQRSLGARLQRPGAVSKSNNSVTNENEKVQIEQRIKNGELPEPLIPIEEALALAEKGEGKGYYQLAVRYAKGDGVVEDDETAAKFLKKAYDARYPRAVFAVALGIENTLRTYVDAEVCPSCRELLGVTFRGQSLFEVFELKPVSRLPWSGISSGITNEVYVARVKDDYDMARKLGIAAAEKELARFESRIALARAQIKADLEKVSIQKKNDEKARRLIEPPSGGDTQRMIEDHTMSTDDDMTREREEKERELWKSWPENLTDERRDKIRKQTEEKFNCSFLGLFGSTNTWQYEKGRSLIALETAGGFGGPSSMIFKVDSSGRITRISTRQDRDFDELRFFDTERDKALECDRKKWAKEHGMTLDEAKSKYAKWKDERPVGRWPLGGLRRPGGVFGGSLRARRQQRFQEAAAAAIQREKETERQAQAEQEKQQRQTERAEQRQQLQAIQEELKRVREAKAAAEKEGR